MRRKSTGYPYEEWQCKFRVFSPLHLKLYTLKSELNTFALSVKLHIHCISVTYVQCTYITPTLRTPYTSYVILAEYDTAILHNPQCCVDQFHFLQCIGVMYNRDKHTVGTKQLTKRNVLSRGSYLRVISTGYK